MFHSSEYDQKNHGKSWKYWRIFSPKYHLNWIFECITLIIYRCRCSVTESLILSGYFFGQNNSRKFLHLLIFFNYFICFQASIHGKGYLLMRTHSYALQQDAPRAFRYCEYSHYSAKVAYYFTWAETSAAVFSILGAGNNSREPLFWAGHPLFWASHERRARKNRKNVRIKCQHFIVINKIINKEHVFIFQQRAFL